MRRQGYVRLTPNKRDDAVYWWFIREFSDGFVYADGGYVAKAREARKKIREGDGRAAVVRRRLQDRPVGRLMPDGSIDPFDYGPYEDIMLRGTSGIRPAP